MLPVSAPTPHFHRPSETPFGKIQPVFDGFALAETSWATDSSFATSTPRFKLPHKTPETKRRRREVIYTPAPALDDTFSPLAHAPHEDDLFARRLANSGRRTPLAAAPVEKLQDEDLEARGQSRIAEPVVSSHLAKLDCEENSSHWTLC